MSNEKAVNIDEASHKQKRKSSILDFDESSGSQLNAKFENPLADVDDAQLMQDVENFCKENDLMDHLEDMKTGARAAKEPHKVAEATWISEVDREAIIREKTHKWDHPFMLYWLCAMCSLAAATQGMDETANNGAVPIYPQVTDTTCQDKVRC